ncbi:MAG: hypothetical protein PHH60_00890 [Candidatus Margulisbacteria bacterium]|nr:hypothetical protein [Candidatus Margulisiibacteriota bacterium]
MKQRFSIIRRLLAVSLIVALGTPALAGNIALRAGFTPSGYSSGKFTFDSGSDGTTCYDSDGSTQLTSGYAVECYWVGSNGDINDPGYGDDVLVGAVKYVGNDTDTWNSFTGAAGKFFHDYTASSGQFTSGSNIYYRVWNNAVIQAGGAYFGETNLVTANYDGNIMPLPTSHGLNNTSTVLQQAIPSPPTLGTVTPHQASPGGSPSITINANSAIHGRWYNFEVSSPESGSGGPFTFNSYRTATVTNTRHAADVNTGSTKTSTLTLAQTDDNKYVMVRIRAAADYGNSTWTTGGPYLIPQTADQNIPVAITDLQATTEGTTLFLSWSAPYDTDRYGAITTCTQYDIRVSNEALVDYPVSPFISGETNPLLVSNWGPAVSIAAYFTPAPAIPAPLAYSINQSVTITGVPVGQPMHFGIKSRDTVGNWSYISNIVGLGGGGGSADNLTIAFDISGNVVLNWTGNGTSYNIWAAGSNEVFSLLAGSVTGTSYTDTSVASVGERYYQVRVSGGTAAPQTVGKYTYNFRKESGKTGINTFALPFGANIRGRNVSTIASADNIINDIGVGLVEFVGQWNDVAQKAEGRVVYTTNPSNWHGPNFSLAKGKSYQISVSDNVTWSIIGQK